MALIQCTGCGHMVSDKAVKCPKCGIPIRKVEEAAKNMEEIKKVISKDESPIIKNPISERQKKRAVTPQHHTWKILCGIIVLVAIALGGFYSYKDRQEKVRLEYEAMIKAKADSAMVADSLARVAAVAEQARLDSIKHANIKAAMPVVEDFFRFYYDDFEGRQNKYIDWIPTNNTINALIAKGYEKKSIETESVEGEGGEYENITIITLCFTIKEGYDDIQYYEIKIAEGNCGGINIVFHDEDTKKVFVTEALHYGFVRNSEGLVGGYYEDDALVWTLKGGDGQLWVYDGDVGGEFTISIDEKSVTLNYGCV